MFRNRHKPLVFALALALVLQIALFPALAVAEEKLPSVATPVAPAISLDQAIQIVKEKFQIPAELNEFFSGYNNYNNRETWSL
ncbi:MAG: YcdB/YcdC domain-containing protein, partial [Desulfitobacteriaceae bacterium]